jgi:hypothetical protein
MASFCPSCGAPLQPGASFCSNCRQGVAAAPPPPQGYGAAQPGGDPEARSSATTALVLSLVGLFCLPIVFSIIGLVKGLSAKEKLARAGEPTGTATAAVVIGIIGMVWGVIAGFVFLASMAANM